MTALGIASVTFILPEVQAAPPPIAPPFSCERNPGIFQGEPGHPCP